MGQIDPDPDADDVRRVLGGDIDAFEGIVRRWQAPLLNLAHRLCRDRNLAEDLAQMAFVKAYRSLKQWRGDASFSSWLFAVAYSVYRAELRRRRPVVAASQERVEPSDADAESRERRVRVHRAVASLPQKYRDALVLYYFHGLSVEQTSRTLRVAPGTIKARLHRARQLLRETLAAWDERDEG
jgi:RNA polymerase sigma-70 factor (ECF subfamily)